MTSLTRRQTPPFHLIAFLPLLINIVYGAVISSPETHPTSRNPRSSPLEISAPQEKRQTYCYEHCCSRSLKLCCDQSFGGMVDIQCQRGASSNTSGGQSGADPILPPIASPSTPAFSYPTSYPTPTFPLANTGTPHLDFSTHTPYSTPRIDSESYTPYTPYSDPRDLSSQVSTSTPYTTSTSSPGDSTSSSSKSESGLSTSDKIAIGIGLPGALTACIGLWIFCKSRGRKAP
ncbi:hypothetical protein CC1G_08421 [Coprinopsis cinerea okayama7|uniref:Hydrophobin n=1 Tax=Coprinopsis cinerea (strain Okayama-7 / 130 / ATCC MYA-4618 / FGSC 9003) TaxID=240176 RepID=A8NAQ2_COPC7|nr:hypothetical protein CC1G_08421 [Coprinopsis cinerea okayama7\|eukprot:XP_001831904.2 hypothetical protein CC1G_08421 [Coprinopsis cinerea okayama7\